MAYCPGFDSMPHIRQVQFLLFFAKFRFQIAGDRSCFASNSATYRSNVRIVSRRRSGQTTLWLEDVDFKSSWWLLIAGDYGRHSGGRRTPVSIRVCPRPSVSTNAEAAGRTGTNPQAGVPTPLTAPPMSACASRSVRDPGRRLYLPRLTPLETSPYNESVLE